MFYSSYFKLTYRVFHLEFPRKYETLIILNIEILTIYKNVSSKFSLISDSVQFDGDNTTKEIRTLTAHAILSNSTREKISSVNLNSKHSSCTLSNT